MGIGTALALAVLMAARLRAPVMGHGTTRLTIVVTDDVP